MITRHESARSETHLPCARRRRRWWCRRRPSCSRDGAGRRPARGTPASSGPAGRWSEPWGRRSSPCAPAGGSACRPASAYNNPVITCARSLTRLWPKMSFNNLFLWLQPPSDGQPKYHLVHIWLYIYVYCVGLSETCYSTFDCFYCPHL